MHSALFCSKCLCKNSQPPAKKAGQKGIYMQVFCLCVEERFSAPCLGGRAQHIAARPPALETKETKNKCHPGCFLQSFAPVYLYAKKRGLRAAHDYKRAVPHASRRPRQPARWPSVAAPPARPRQTAGRRPVASAPPRMLTRAAAAAPRRAGPWCPNRGVSPVTPPAPPHTCSLVLLPLLRDPRVLRVEVGRLARHARVEVEHVVDRRLKVRRRVVARRDEALVAVALRRCVASKCVVPRGWMGLFGG